MLLHAMRERERDESERAYRQFFFGVDMNNEHGRVGRVMFRLLSLSL